MPEPRLQVRDSRGQRVVLLDKPAFTIGRRSSCDLALTDSEISREHAEITRVDDGYVLRDRGSRYGTFVNGAALTREHPLAHGDCIRLGRGSGAEVRFLIGDQSDGSGVDSSGAGFRQVAVLLDALQALGGARVLDEVLALVLDTAIEMTMAERGFIMLADSEGRLEFKAGRARGRVSLAGDSFQISHKIPEDVFASGGERIVSDLRDGDMAAAHEGTVALGIRHVLCVPLRIVRYVERPDLAADARAIGVLYLDSRERGTLLSPGARAALGTMAVEAAAAIESARLYRQAIDKARMDDDLRIASQIQRALLPAGRRTGPFFEVAGASNPCREIGGDFFDYIDLADGRFAFALGDVAGKGTPAALLTAVLQGMLSGQASTMQDPADTMARVNRALLARAIEARFATAFLGVLGRNGQLTYCNAGHNPPFVFRQGGVERLTVGGTVLGLFAHAAYEQAVTELQPGDTVLVFSDGVSEALNGAGDEFGDERIGEAVAPVLQRGPQDVLEALLAAVKQFAGGAAPNDDVTVVTLRYAPGRPPEFVRQPEHRQR